MTALPAVSVGSHERVALISDVHGNAWALRAVIATLAEHGVTALCSLGCLTWGPEPRRVMVLLDELPVPVYRLAGNGERAVIEMAVGQRPIERETHEWIVRAHGDDVDRLREQPTALTLTVPSLGPIRLCHGSPRSDVELLTPATPHTRVAAACEGVPEQTIVHGHTHLQYGRRVADRVVQGCGSVGLPYTHDGPAAYWTLADADGLHPQRTEYDIDSAARELSGHRFPGAARFADQIRAPTDPDWIVQDAEAREFAD
ncbi:metallophosphatase family protein [Jatrophihabitans cynanchi]|uniref:Metallophosphatase family protein n=1 Tax=Jatrophihabitans cynanchi TaxID=2944128 RepID=A0ABY7JV37_9ACTN|nr:metallophosphoesterase family protein [Jatrophihabitans sp. SB3-54]WAX56224.1 metallophosphatase family protein [Jatrophihabitans sp. SB3-54]